MRKLFLVFLLGIAFPLACLSSVSASSTYNVVSNPTLKQQGSIAGDFVITWENINWGYTLYASGLTNSFTTSMSFPSLSFQQGLGVSNNNIRFLDSHSWAYSSFSPINLGRFAVGSEHTYLIAIQFQNYWSEDFINYRRIEYAIFNATDVTFTPIYSPSFSQRYEEYYIETGVENPVITMRTGNIIEYWTYSLDTNSISKVWEISVNENAWTNAWKRNLASYATIIKSSDNTSNFFLFSKRCNDPLHCSNNPLQVFNPVNGNYGAYGNISASACAVWDTLGVSNSFPFILNHSLDSALFVYNQSSPWYCPNTSYTLIGLEKYSSLSDNFPVINYIVDENNPSDLVFQSGALGWMITATSFENPRLYFKTQRNNTSGVDGYGIIYSYYYWDTNCTQNGFPSCQYDVQTGQDFCGDGNGNFPTERISCNVTIDIDEWGTWTTTSTGNLFSDMFDELGIESAPTWKNGVTMTGAIQSCTGVTFSGNTVYTTSSGVLDSACDWRRIVNTNYVQCSTEWGLVCKSEWDYCSQELENPEQENATEQYLGDINRYNCSAWAVSCRWSTATSCWPNATCMVDWDYCKVKPDSIPQIVNDNGEEKESDSFFGGLFGGIMDSISNLWENLSNSMIGIGLTIKEALIGTGTIDVWGSGTGVTYSTSTNYIYTGSMSIPTYTGTLNESDLYTLCPSSLSWVSLGVVAPILDIWYDDNIPLLGTRIQLYPFAPLSCLMRSLINIKNGASDIIQKANSWTLVFLWISKTSISSGSGVKYTGNVLPSSLWLPTDFKAWDLVLLSFVFYLIYFFFLKKEDTVEVDK